MEKERDILISLKLENNYRNVIYITENDKLSHYNKYELQDMEDMSARLE